MEFRSQKIIGAAVVILALPLWAGAGGLQYQARHDHLRKACGGILRVTEQGVSFEQTDAKKPEERHVFEWRYPDIQQLEVAPGELRVLTYKDNAWKLGADREYRFRIAGGDLRDAYALLKDKLDQRFVAALADESVKALWEVPVKHATRFGGSEGLLRFAEDRIVFQTERKGDSRTWRFEDIENISTSGPFQLTLTTYERALSHYGSLKGFNFQLKEPLPEARYNDLWRRLNQSKGLKLLTLKDNQEKKGL